MSQYFADIPNIVYEGEKSTNPLAFHYYDPDYNIMGKTMREHLRLAVCYWHTFCWNGDDSFGIATFQRPWQHADPMTQARKRVKACFAFIEKLGVPFLTFHDRDIAPEGNSIAESADNLQMIGDVIGEEMSRTGIGLLWGTANLFSHPRYMAGAATNPNPEIFAYACNQVKTALDLTHRLGGANYVLWGGREGYDSLLNTNMKQELEQMGRFLSLLVDYKYKIGFKGLLLLEPKPCEPMKHQYDFDVATVYAFLQQYGLEKEFKVNIEANHATLSGHRFAHEVSYALDHDLLGSIDANRGDPQLGWDTDQFPANLTEIILVLFMLLKQGGFSSGGFNFDTKLRRQSIDLEDLFYSHIGGIDSLARALRIAHHMLESPLADVTNKRYQNWRKDLGRDILTGKLDFTTIADYAMTNNLNPNIQSGHQELLERYLNDCIK